MHANGVSTPCEDEKLSDENGEDFLSVGDSKVYGELAAQANYLAQDRCDIQIATKEICKCMCQP